MTSGQATRRTSDTIGGCCIQASMDYLQAQEWWPAFRDRRRSTARLTDDVLWVGHFCWWAQQHALAVEDCTDEDLAAYLATTALFRPGPRAACESTVTALVDFLARTRREGAGID